MRAPQDYLSEQRNTELFVEQSSAQCASARGKLIDQSDVFDYLGRLCDDIFNTGPVWFQFEEAFTTESRIAELSQDEKVFNLEIQYKSGYPPRIKYQKYEL